MDFTEQDRSGRFRKQPSWRPDAIQTDDMSDSPSSETSSTKKALARAAQTEDDDEEEDMQVSPSEPAVNLLMFSQWMPHPQCAQGGIGG